MNSNKKAVIITGITGQDGSYLAEYLLKKKYNIFGLTRKNIKIKNKYLKKIKNKIKLIQTNYSKKQIEKLIRETKPKYIFHLGGQSIPSKSWEKSTETLFSIVNINIRFIEGILKFSKKTRYFNASTSQIFKDTKNILNESSEIKPSNPYGCAKACSHFLIKAYREKYNLYLVNGILFNHDSPRRSLKFVGKKIIHESLKIKLKEKSKLIIQNFSPIRDFGYAKDYVVAMCKIMNKKNPEDFVIATGNSKSVGDYAKKVFNILRLDKRKIVNLQIKNDVKNSERVDVSKIIKKTGWKPNVNFIKMLKIMIKNELDENFKSHKNKKDIYKIYKLIK